MKVRQQFVFILIFALFLLGNAGHFMLPQVFTNSQGRSFSGTTKANLHNMYLACNSFWAAEGDSKTCTVSIATRKEFGWFQSQEVKIYGSGTKNEFCAFAWSQGNNILHKIDSRGTIDERAEAFKKILNKAPPNKIRVYEKLLPRHFVYYSWVLILPLMVVKLTSWAGSSSILMKKRKLFSYLTVGLIFVIWAFISLAAFLLAFDSYLWHPYTFYMLLVIPLIFSALRASSLIEWGKQIETGIKIGEELPDYLKNQNAEKLKKSGNYLYGVIGILLVVNIAYGFMFSIYKINYKNQSVTFSEEIEKVNQGDPYWFQKICPNL